MDTFRVTFTPEKLKAFEKELAKETDPDATFTFEGGTWLVAYARYVVEYLKGTFMAQQMKGEKMEYQGNE